MFFLSGFPEGLGPGFRNLRALPRSCTFKPLTDEVPPGTTPYGTHAGRGYTAFIDLQVRQKIKCRIVGPVLS